MSDTILAYDLGTGGIKSSIYNADGQSLCENFTSYSTYYNGNYHEQNPDDWWNAVIKSTKSLLENPAFNTDSISSIAVSGHSLGALPVDLSGDVLLQRVPIWSDGRALKESETFFKKVPEDEWYLTTGNGFPAQLYAIFKIMWYKANAPSVYKKAAKFIGTKDYINYMLTGNLYTDYSYASGSGVYDLKAWRYKEEYLAAAEIDASKLPEIIKSTDIVGSLSVDAAHLLGINPGIRVACGGVDNACMALGAGCISEGNAYTSLGSSSWIAVSGSAPIVDTQFKPYVFTHCIPGMFVSSEAIFSAGSSFRWLKENLCKELSDIEEPYNHMTYLAEKSPIGANKLIFNPTLAGASCLDKSPNVKGGFFGLELGHSQSDIIRSVLEGICLNLRVALDVMSLYCKLSDDMLIVGGGGKSRFWRRLFADIYNKNIIETNVGQDAGSLGAAALAAVAVGLWKDFSVVPMLHHEYSRIEPVRENNIKYEVLLKLFKQVSNLNADICDIIAKTDW